MTYGVENIFSKEPFSLILSIFLILGVSNLGIFFQNFIKKKYSIKYLTNHFFSPIFGSYLLIFFLSPLALLNLFDIFFIKLLSIILVILGFFLTIKIFNLYIRNYKFKFNVNFILIISFTLLFFISASPITHADSLAYHLDAALRILEQRGYSKDILPFDDKLAGGGELLIALGLSIGLQQFGALIQYSSLFSLIPIFKRDKADKNSSILLFIILFTPITIFLISSPKPQLMPSIVTLIVFSCAIKNFKENKNINLLNFILISLIFINFLIKFNFILSASIIFLILFYENLLIKNKVNFLLVTVFSSIIIVIPLLLFKILYFQSSLINLMISPLPLSIHGYDKFHYLLTGDESAKNIFNLIYPNTLGEFSTIFGPAILLIFFLNLSKLSNKIKLYLLLFFIFFIIQIYFGSSLNRFYFEIYICLLYILSLTGFKYKNLSKLIYKYFYIQNFIIFLVCILFSLMLFPGSISNNYYQKIMHKTANDYSLINWANNYLSKDDVVLSYNRSVVLYKVKAYYQDFLWYIDLKDSRSDIFIEFIKSKKINRIVIGDKNLELGDLKNCVGRLVAKKKNVGSKVGRNPFNNGDNYDGWILELNYQELPDCIIGKSKR